MIYGEDKIFKKIRLKDVFILRLYFYRLSKGCLIVSDFMQYVYLSSVSFCGEKLQRSLQYILREPYFDLLICLFNEKFSLEILLQDTSRLIVYSRKFIWMKIYIL